MKNEPRKFQAALVLFTRLPLASAGLEERHFHLTHYYLPVVGLVIGLITAAVYLIANLYLSPSTAALTAILAGTLLTGALHEDGLADCCDGFGGGRTPEAIQTIMKDSCLGSYGVIGLIAIFGLKLAFLTDIIVEWQAVALVVMHVLARITPLLVMTTLPRASSASTRMTGHLETSAIRLALIVLATAGGLFITMPFQLSCFLIVAVSATALICHAWFHHRLAGYTGDCLGAGEQLTELSLLATIAIYY